MSTKIGLSPFHSSAWLVATKEHGVVITSPVTRNACSAVMSARVALAKSTMCFTPQVLAQGLFQRMVHVAPRWSGNGSPRSFPSRG
ncbi:Uncharacterised protein [Pseudomonas aeruginosa]|nr:Uncharacterised protein [Pseudomonas aeruginosa]